MRIILASKSPRRKEIFSSLAAECGFDFEIITAPTDEELYGEHPKSGVATLAVRKGEAVYKKHPDSLVVSSDTLVELDGIPLGKPTDRNDAVRMLKELSGRAHNVHTGIAVHYGGRVVSGVATTAVIFRELSDSEIIDYVESGEPMDKAGGYGIQGKGCLLVERIEGDYLNVVGLPAVKLAEILKEEFNFNIM